VECRKKQEWEGGRRQSRSGWKEWQGKHHLSKESSWETAQEGKVDRNSLAAFGSTDKSSERGVMGIASS
jgi:hypothetical protein